MIEFGLSLGRKLEGVIGAVGVSYMEILSSKNSHVTVVYKHQL